MSTTPTKKQSPEETDDNALLMFDEQLNKIFREACQAAFLKVPELRSVVVTYDYFRSLNDMEGISKGMWLHTSGEAVKPADSIVGSTRAVLQSAAHLLDEQMNLSATLAMQATEYSKMSVQLQKDIDAKNPEFKSQQSEAKHGEKPKQD